jgi:CRP-like cAMP-binding protein
MPEKNQSRSYQETRISFRDQTPIIPERPIPRQNHLLARLPARDYERLLPALKSVYLPQGWTVHGTGEKEKYLYFLTAGIALRTYLGKNAEQTELGITGSEGVIGIASFLGGESSLHQAVMLSYGHAYRLSSDLVKGEIRGNSQLAQLLLRYTQTLMTQVSQIAVCNRHHSIEQRLCRWLLDSIDRLPDNRLDMTQELIANMLGVRREGVTEAAGKLQKLGIIGYHRGHIIVLNRPKLEQLCCECYTVVKNETTRLLHDTP